MIYEFNIIFSFCSSKSACIIHCQFINKLLINSLAWTCTNENSFFDFRKNIYQTLQIWLIQLGFNANFDPKEFDCLIKHHLNDIQINETVLKVKNF